MHMPGTKSSEPKAPEEKWIPYRENGEVKYMRAEDATNFTSSGGDAKDSKVSAWANLPAGGFVGNSPNLLQERYTDESIIPVMVTNVIPAEKSAEPKKTGFLSKLKKDSKPSTTKAVWMPRGEYKKHFAKDNTGKYIGTEPQRDWTEEELEDEFGQYHKETGGVPTGFLTNMNLTLT